MTQEEKIKEIIESCKLKNFAGIEGAHGDSLSSQKLEAVILDWHTSELNRKMRRVLKYFAVIANDSEQDGWKVEKWVWDLVEALGYRDLLDETKDSNVWIEGIIEDLRKNKDETNSEDLRSLLGGEEK